MSLSKYLVEIIDDAMRRSASGISPREKTENELAQATRELEKLRKQNESLKVHLKRTEESEAKFRNSVFDLAEYTSKQARDDETVGKLVALFKKRRIWPIEEVPKELGIDTNDEKAMRALTHSIDFLKRIGLIEGDFGELRCRIGVRKRTTVPHKFRRNRHGKYHKGVSRRLQPAGDDSDDSPFVPVEP